MGDSSQKLGNWRVSFSSDSGLKLVQAAQLVSAQLVLSDVFLATQLVSFLRRNSKFLLITLAQWNLVNLVRFWDFLKLFWVIYSLAEGDCCRTELIKLGGDKYTPAVNWYNPENVPLFVLWLVEHMTRFHELVYSYCEWAPRARLLRTHRVQKSPAPGQAAIESLNFCPKAVTVPSSQHSPGKRGWKCSFQKRRLDKASLNGQHSVI